jgi:hypothetical protein
MIHSRIGLLCLLGAMACAASPTGWASAGAPAVRLPQQFQPDPAFPLVSDTSATCLVHLVDPREGTRLTLAQSNGGPGTGNLRRDYDIDPPGRYGLTPGHRLRLDCLSRKAIGIVRS